MDYETIAAMATPMGTSGIGIIRISGSNAVSIVEPIFRTGYAEPSKRDILLSHLPTHHLKHGHIIDPRKNGIVDEVMVVVMRAPHSYTREDVVEIQSHSGHVSMSAILNLVLDQGARLSEPGEFTKRAYLNGRIDLSQAEAVADVISARSESALQLANTHLTGHMRHAVERLMERLGDIQVELEANIEFPDEVGEGVDLVPIQDMLSREVLAPIETLIEQYHDGRILKDGVQLGIVGRPNVGKSSLLNRILSKDKAIVTSVPGTTRDLIEDHTCIEGVPIVITDTAGLRPSIDPVEIVGIEKAHQRIETSDLILFVVDGSQPLNDQDLAVFERVKTSRCILCINKDDLFEGNEDLNPFKFPGKTTVVRISAKTGAGLDTLKKAIKDQCLHGVKIEPGRSIVPNQRQKIALQDAHEYLVRALKAIEKGITEELIISDLSQAKSALGKIVGLSVDVDILDDIFDRFCIGK